MAQKYSKTTIQLKPQRVFSKAIKQQIVRDIERGKCSVTQASKELGVTTSSIYKWIHLFSRHLVKNRVMVVEDKSEAYRSENLEKRIKELEAALGRKQMEVDYLEKIIELANKDLNVDLKKSIKNPHSKASEKPKGKRTGTK